MFVMKIKDTPSHKDNPKVMMHSVTENFAVRYT